MAKLKTQMWRVAIGLFAVASLSVLFIPKHSQAAAGILQQMNYQGRLLTAAGAVVPDGNYNIEFKIYQDGPGNVAGDTGGTLKWTEDYVYGTNSPDNRVAVKNGYFSVMLGSICPLGGAACTANTGNSQSNSAVDFNQDTLWLSINIGNTSTASTFAGASGDGEMLSMKRLGAVPYALNANKFGGLIASQYVQLAQGLQTDSSNSNASIAINKTGSANLLTFQNSGSSVLTITNTGATTFENSSNSATAFQIQNASAATLFNVDTTATSNLITNGGFEGGGTTGWAAKSGATLSQSSSQQWEGNNSLSVATTTTAGDGAKYTGFTLVQNQQYTFSFYAKASSGTITDINVGHQNNTTNGEVDCLTGQTLTTSWNRYTCTFQDNTSINTNYIYIKKTGSSAETFFIDGVQFQTGASLTPFNPGGALQFEGVVNSPFALQNKSDSTNAFQIQNAAGTSNLLLADTLNSKVYMGGGFLEVYKTAAGALGPQMLLLNTGGGANAADSIDFYTYGGGSNPAARILATDAGNFSGTLAVQTKIPGATNNALATTFSLSSTGQALFQNQADSTTAFQIQNAGGTTTLLAADTSGSNITVKSLLTLNNGGGATASPSLTAGVLKFDAMFDNSGNSTANKIILYDNGSNWRAGLGISNNSFNLFSGGDIHFYTGHQNETTMGSDTFNMTSAGAIALDSGITSGTLTADIAGTTTAHGVCHSGAAGAAENVQFVACSGTAGADYAELYPSQRSVTAGDIVMPTSAYATSLDGKYQVPVLAKTQDAYDSGEIGVISEIDPGSDESNLTGHNVRAKDNPMPLALNGRVMTKVSAENGPVSAGDYITASSIPGVGMKATRSGEVVGRAMQSLESGQGQILVFINPFYYSGPTGLELVQGQTSSVDAGSISLSPGGDTSLSQGLSFDSSDSANLKSMMQNIKAYNGETHIAGTLYADKIKANQIEGLEVYTDVLGSLEEKLGPENASQTNGNTTGSTSQPSPSQPLNLNVGSALSVGGPAEFHGNALFFSLVSFIEKTIFKNDVSFAAHVTTEGNSPTASLEAAAGDVTPGDSAPAAKVTISGNDNSGQLNINVGSNPTPGAIIAVDFAKPYARAPQVFLTPTSGAAAQLKYYIVQTPGGFKILATDPPTPGSNLLFNYLVIQ